MAWLCSFNDELRPANNLQFPEDGQDTLLDGYAVSMWDQFAVVGAPAKTAGGFAYSGEVTVYKLNGSTWQQFTKLFPANNIDSAVFGASVNICGNYMIIAAPSQKMN